jgi:hypothetical protein
MRIFAAGAPAAPRFPFLAEMQIGILLLFQDIRPTCISIPTYVVTALLPWEIDRLGPNL